MNDHDDLLEELLNTELVSSETNEQENAKLAPLLTEIDLIQDQSLRLFVRAVLLRSETFWDIPSSFSGKYHPPDEHGPGGNVLHTKRVVRIVQLICQSQERTDFETDMLLAAALLHDLTKGKEQDGDVQYDSFHPYTVDSFIQRLREEEIDTLTVQLSSSSTYLEEEYVQQILRLIRCHLGVWSPIPETMPVTTLEWALHIADYVASKLHWIVDGEDIDVGRWIR